VSGDRAGSFAGATEVPRYLADNYWWAYIHPAAVRVFERQWLVNLILCGNYARLRDAALEELGPSLGGRTLQVACVYGDLTPRLAARVARGGILDVVDILPVQLSNLARKLAGGSGVRLWLGDSSNLGVADGSYDRALLFFLLHEQPGSVRRATLAEALRVVKPGGKIVVIEYHEPSHWHPLKAILRVILRRLEPYALDLWQEGLERWLPEGPVRIESKRTYFGGLYQKTVLKA
jgi:ubiquinone/menaquinone biosynthesis C-methylase UbiE